MYIVTVPNGPAVMVPGVGLDVHDEPYEANVPLTGENWGEVKAGIDKFCSERDEKFHEGHIWRVSPHTACMTVVTIEYSEGQPWHSIYTWRVEAMHEPEPFDGFPQSWGDAIETQIMNMGATLTQAKAELADLQSMRDKVNELADEKVMNIKQRFLLRDIAELERPSVGDGASPRQRKYINRLNELITNAYGIMTQFVTPEVEAALEEWRRLGYSSAARKEGWDMMIVYGQYTELRIISMKNNHITDETSYKARTGTGEHHRFAREVIFKHNPCMWVMLDQATERMDKITFGGDMKLPPDPMSI